MNDCIRVSESDVEGCPRDCGPFLVETTEKTFVFAVETAELDDWIQKLCEIAFPVFNTEFKLCDRLFPLFFPVIEYCGVTAHLTTGLQQCRTVISKFLGFVLSCVPGFVTTVVFVP